MEPSGHFCHQCGLGTEVNGPRCGRCGEGRPAGGWPSDPLIGQVLGGRFRLEYRLGMGGMGTVYRATRVDLDAPVALKLLSEEFTGSVIERRFRREAKVVASLTSPHVVRLIDFGTTAAGQLFQVMELVEGTTLEDRLVQQGRLSVGSSIRVLDQVCEGLHSAHVAGVVHRDLKPANIMLVPSARGDFVKLLDFGIAGIVPRLQGPATKLTEVGMVQGTPHYMSPEQVLGQADRVDGRSDIYALGVIAYELLSGAPPFTGDSAVGIMVQHVKAEVPPLAERVRGDSVPGSLMSLVHQMLAKEPADRPEDVRAVQRALLACAEAAAELALGPPEAQASDTGEPPTRLMSAEELQTLVTTPQESPAPAPRTGPTPRDSFFETPSLDRPSEPSILDQPRLKPRGQGLLVAFLLVATLGGLGALGWLVYERLHAPVAPGGPAAAGLKGGGPMDPARRKRYGLPGSDLRHFEARKGGYRLTADQRPARIQAGTPFTLDMELFETDADDGSESTASPERVEIWFETMRTHEPVSKRWSPPPDAQRLTVAHRFAKAGRYHLRVLVWPAEGKPIRLTLNFLVPERLGGLVPPLASGPHHPHPEPWR